MSGSGLRRAQKAEAEVDPERSRHGPALPARATGRRAGLRETRRGRPPRNGWLRGGSARGSLSIRPRLRQDLGRGGELAHGRISAAARERWPNGYPWAPGGRSGPASATDPDQAEASSPISPPGKHARLPARPRPAARLRQHRGQPDRLPARLLGERRGHHGALQLRGPGRPARWRQTALPGGQENLSRSTSTPTSARRTAPLSSAPTRSRCPMSGTTRWATSESEECASTRLHKGPPKSTVATAFAPRISNSCVWKEKIWCSNESKSPTTVRVWRPS